MTANIEMNNKQFLNGLCSIKKCIDTGILSALKNNAKLILGLQYNFLLSFISFMMSKYKYEVVRKDETRKKSMK